MRRPPILFAVLLLLQVVAALLLLQGLFPPLAKGPRVTAAPPAAKPAMPAQPPKPAAAVILCYHSVSNNTSTLYVTSVKDFTKQMDWLAQKHFKVVPLSRLVDYYAAHQPLPDSTVAITFDDGYESVLKEAWPVLKKHGFPFAVFIYPSYIERGRGSMSWKQVAELDKAGVTVGSHSMTHPVLTRTQGLSEAAYKKWLARELQGSRDTLEKRLGHAVDLLAYPFGAFDHTVEQAAQAAGYRACFLVNAGVNDSATSIYQLDRVIIGRNFPFPLYQTILATHCVQLADIRPYQGEEVKASRNLDISARIANYKDLVPSSVRILVSKGHGKGMVDSSEARARFLLVQPLKKGFHEAAVYARNRNGQKCVGCWMFLVRE